MGEPLGAVRHANSTQPDDGDSTRFQLLHDRWRDASARSGWPLDLEWNCQSVIATVRSLLAGGVDEIRSSCTWLGAERAAAGTLLDELRADVLAGATVANLAPLIALNAVDAATLGWLNSTLDALVDPACIDPLTQLASPSYLHARTAEIYAAARHSGTDLTASGRIVGVRTSRRADALVREAEMITVQAALRGVFAGGETLARVSPDLVVALVVPACEELTIAVDELTAELLLAYQRGRIGQTSVSVTAFPPELIDFAVVLRGLHR